jgi:hypothetical protein
MTGVERAHGRYKADAGKGIILRLASVCAGPMAQVGNGAQNFHQALCRA